MLDALHQMRPTLNLDDEVLASARRQPPSPEQALQRNGLPLLPRQPGGAPVDLDLVNPLRDETA